MFTACCTSRKNSLPRLREGRRLNRKGELIQIVIELFVADCPLMGSYEPPL